MVVISNAEMFVGDSVRLIFSMKSVLGNNLEKRKERYEHHPWSLWWNA